MSETPSTYRPDVAIPPGETLQETIDALGITQADLARRMGRPLKTINEIINGKAMITSETALQLDLVLGVPAVFWINLERNYQLTKARLAEDERFAKEIALTKHYPYSDLARHGCVKSTRKSVDRVRELVKFFGVNSLSAVELPDCEFRVAMRSRPAPESLAAWLRMGDLASRGVNTGLYNADLLTSMIPDFRALTLSESGDWSNRLKSLCAKAGVVVVYVPHLTKSFAHGATRWISPTKALIQLSLRGVYADVFWFSFFHELGHIVKHGKREVFIEIQGAAVNPKEAEADAFAADALVPKTQYTEFTRRGVFDEHAVRKFAASVKIHPGIVVGRLHHDYQNHGILNHLRRRLQRAPQSSESETDGE